MQATALNAQPVQFTVNVLHTFTPNAAFPVTTFEYKGNTFARHVYTENDRHIECIIRLENDKPTHLHTVLIDKTDRFPVNFPLMRPITELPKKVLMMRQADEAMRYTHMVEIE